MLVEPVSFPREKIKCCSAITCFIVIMKTTQNSPSSPFLRVGTVFQAGETAQLLEHWLLIQEPEFHSQH